MWTTKDIPDQTGKTVLVTGANTGIGFEIALALYQAGAHVVITGRDTEKVEQAANRLKIIKGNGKVETGIVNLASLSDVKRYADEFKETHSQLHLLINNAGVMMPPASFTKEGYELQFGVNFLGHFALMGHLYSVLKQASGARVVTLSSGAHKWVEEIDFANLKAEKSYDPNREYGVSKLADLLFALELQRRFDQIGDKLISTAAHPGITRTDLQRHLEEDALKIAFSRYPVIMQPWQGALPALFAATSFTVKGGDYYGPDGENELSGYPALAQIGKLAQNRSAAKQLWQYAELATGLHYPRAL